MKIYLSNNLKNRKRTLQEQKFFKAFLEVMHKSKRHCSVVIENMSMLVFNVKKPTNKMYMIG